MITETASYNMARLENIQKQKEDMKRKFASITHWAEPVEQRSNRIRIMPTITPSNSTIDISQNRMESVEKMDEENYFY